MVTVTFSPPRAEIFLRPLRATLRKNVTVRVPRDGNGIETRVASRLAGSDGD